MLLRQLVYRWGFSVFWLAITPHLQLLLSHLSVHVLLYDYDYDCNQDHGHGDTPIMYSSVSLYLLSSSSALACFHILSLVIGCFELPIPDFLLLPHGVNLARFRIHHFSHIFTLRVMNIGLYHRTSQNSYSPNSFSSSPWSIYSPL